MSGFDAVAVGRRVLAIEGEALALMSENLGEAFTQAVEVLFACKGRIVLTGMGKSGHVARKITATLASTGTPAMFVHPAEASHGDLGMIGQDDVVLALSKTEANGVDDGSGLVDDEDYGPVGKTGDFRLAVPLSHAFDVALGDRTPWAPAQNVTLATPDVDIALGAADQTPLHPSGTTQL